MAETGCNPITVRAATRDVVASISWDGTGAFKVESEGPPQVRTETLYKHYNGNLAQHIVTSSKDEKLQMCTKVMQMVVELHQRNIIHGSICSANVNWSKYSVSLSNAGFFAFIQRQLKYVPLLPCTPYRSREELLHDKWRHSKAGDIYAVTVLVYTVFAGREPYSEIPLIRLVSKIASVGYTGLEKPELMSSGLWCALMSFWKAQPESRQTAFEQVRVSLLRDCATHSSRDPEC